MYQHRRIHIQQYLCHWKNGDHKGLFRGWKVWTFAFNFRNTLDFLLFTKIFTVQWKYSDHALCLTCHFFSTCWSSIQVPFSLWVLPDHPYENNCNFFTVPIVFDLLGHFWHSMAYSESTFLPLRTGSKSSFIHSLSQLVNHSSSHLSIW